MTVSSDEQENYVGALTAMTLQSRSMLDSSFLWHSQWEQMRENKPNQMMACGMVRRIGLLSKPTNARGGFICICAPRVHFAAFFFLIFGFRR